MHTLFFLRGSTDILLYSSKSTGSEMLSKKVKRLMFRFSSCTCICIFDGSESSSYLASTLNVVFHPHYLGFDLTEVNKFTAREIPDFNLHLLLLGTSADLKHVPCSRAF